MLILEKRAYFIVGDILSVIVAGVVVAFLCLALIPSDWNMFFAMFVGMALGMAVSLLTCASVFVRYFGAMEVMVPTMLTGMLVGMVISMALTMTEVSYSCAVTWGIVIGLFTLVGTYILNVYLSGTR